MSVPVVYLVRVATWQMICRVNGLWSGVHALTILGIKQNSFSLRLKERGRESDGQLPPCCPLRIGF